MNRRDFLKASAGFTATTLLLGLSGHSLIASTKNSTIPLVTLNNVLKIPMIGFGTNTLNDDLGVKSVANAIDVGYRLIDTATIYGNEEAVGEGVRQSKIDRKQLMISSKLWVDDSGYETTKKAFQTSLDKLGTDYLDIYLIHRPRGDVKGSWKAMEELYKAGKIRAIGVSNFNKEQLESLLSDATVKPVMNQIETHVFYQEHEAYRYLKQLDIQHQAWSPFAAGRNNIFTNPVLDEIAKKHDKSIAQICLRWHFQRGIVTIPRSSQRTHMIENLAIFDFELDKADFKKIETLDLNVTQFPEWE